MYIFLECHKKYTRSFLSYPAKRQTDRQTAVKTAPSPKVAKVNVYMLTELSEIINHVTSTDRCNVV